jgi:hypothetical protein
MVRSQNLLRAPPLAHSPLSFSALSVNGACPDPVGVLRKTRSLTQIDPSAPLLSHRHSPDAAIPFRITSFAHPHHLTPIESYSCKKQGRGWGIQRFHPAQPLPLFSTTSRHPAHSTAHMSTLFMRLLHGSLDTRSGGRSPSLFTTHCSLPTVHYSLLTVLPRTSTLPPPIYGIIPPHRGSTRNPIHKRGGFSD